MAIRGYEMDSAHPVMEQYVIDAMIKRKYRMESAGWLGCQLIEYSKSWMTRLDHALKYDLD